MQDTPDVNLGFPLDIEDKIRILLYGTEAQAGEVELMRIAGRTRLRSFTDMADGIFERVNEGQRNCFSRLGQIMLDCLFHIALRTLAKDNLFAAHCAGVWRTRLRSWLK